MNLNLLTILMYWSSLAVRSGKKSPNQETGFGNRRRLKDLNDTKLVLNEHETSPISQTSFLVGTFFAVSYCKTALTNFCKLLSLTYYTTPAVTA